MAKAATPAGSAGLDFSVFVPFAKVDAVARTVGGWCTVEEPDRQGYVLDYESARDALLKWGGNMREMHDPTRAVGKAVVIQPDDEGKRVWLESYVSKSADGENTWTKIEEGILTGYSLGGALTKRVPETFRDPMGRVVARAREFAKVVSEVSYVDLPAAPSAVFAFVKADGQPADFLEDLTVDDFASRVIASDPEAEPLAKAATPATPAAPDPIEVADNPTPTPAPVEAPGASTPPLTLAKSAADDIVTVHVAAESAHIAMETIARLLTIEAVEGDPAQVGALQAMIAALQTAIEQAASFAAAEATELATPEDTEEATAEAEADIEVPILVAYGMVTGDLAKRAMQFRKAGKRNAASDQASIDQIHDLSVAAGATTCPAVAGSAATGGDDLTAIPIAKSADADPEAPATPAPSPDDLADLLMQKLADRAPWASRQDLDAMRGEMLGAIEPIAGDLAKFAAMPLPGGARRGTSFASGRPEDEDAGAALMGEAAVLAKAATMARTPEVREELGRMAAAAEIRQLTPTR